MIDPIQNRIGSTPRPTLTAASALVCLAVAGLWLTTLAEAALSTTSVALLNALYYLPFVGLPLFICTRRVPGLSRSLRLNPPPMLSMLSVALLALMSVYAASALTAVWGMGLNALGLRAPGAYPAPQTERELLLSILTLAAVPAVFEELLFRGFVLAAWESRGTALAVCLSAGLFALLHGNLYGLPAFFLVGASAGIVAWALDSVYAAIAYHTIYNAACLVIPYLMRGQANAEVAASGSMLFSLVVETLMLLGLMAVLLTSMLLRAHNRGVEPIPRIRRPLTTGERLTLAAAVLLMATSTVIVQVLAMANS